MLSLSVVIPTRNRAAVLRRTLPTALHQDLPQDQWELLIVDDGSTDDTAAVVQELAGERAYLLVQPHRGAAAARNAGLRVARGELVLFLDDDLLCDPSLFTHHLDAHREHPGGVIFGPFRLDPHAPPGMAAELVRTRTNAHFATLAAGASPPRPRDYLLGPNTSVSAALLRQAGGYDEGLLACEDAELGLRLMDGGVPFRYEPRARSYQLHLKTASQLVFDDAPAWGRGELQLVRKHPRHASDSLIGWMSRGPRWRVLARAAAARALLRSHRAWLGAARLVEHCAPAPVRLPFMNLSTAAAMLVQALDDAGSLAQARRIFEGVPERHDHRAVNIQAAV